MKSILSKAGTAAGRSTVQLVLIVSVIFFTVECGSMFFSASSLISIVKQIFAMGITALGISFLITTGNLDFSIGQVYTFAGTMTAFLFSVGVPITLAMLAGLADGTPVPYLTYLISINFKISRLVVSMAVGTAVDGLSRVIARNKTICGLPDSIKWLGQGYLFNLIPIFTVIFLGLAVITSFLFRRTYLGCYLSAVSGDDDMIRLSGIHVNKTELTTSIIGDLLVGIIGLISMSRTFSGGPFSGNSLSQDVTSAAVLGDVSVSGRAGKMSGTVTGMVIIRMLSAGLNTMGFNTDSRDTFRGSMLFVAVILDALSKERKAGIKK